MLVQNITESSGAISTKYSSAKTFCICNFGRSLELDYYEVFRTIIQFKILLYI